MLSVIRVKGGGGEGSPVPGRQDSAVGGRQGRGETEGGGSGDGSLTPERGLGSSPALMTGCPQHRAGLEAGKDGVKQMSAVREGVSARTEEEESERSADLLGSGRAGWRLLASAQTVLGHRVGRPAFALCWSALRGASSTDQERAGPPPLARGMSWCPGCDVNQTRHEADLHNL